MTSDRKPISLIMVICISLGILFSLMVAVGIVAFMSYKSANDYAARTEASLIADRNNSRTLLGSLEQTVLEIMQVDAANRDSAAQLVREAIQGRYGPNGVQAMFVSIQEAGIPLDNTIRTRAVTAIESGRLKYQNSQTLYIQRAADYKGQTDTLWRGFWIKLSGYPKINFEDFKGVATLRADKSFEQGYESAPIQIYKSEKK